MEIAELFPTSLALFAFPEFDKISLSTRTEIKLALRNKSLKSTSTEKRIRQTSDQLHNRPALSPIINFITTSAYEYIAILGDSQRIELRLQCCWATVAYPGDKLDMHAHSNSHISGVFYVDVDENLSGDILFRDPRVQNRMLDLPIKERTPLNEKFHCISPKNGLLLIFPSWLEHRVQPNKSETPRVSLSFNITIHGQLGESKFFSGALL